VSNFEE
jgi:hypothetical protein